MAWDETDRAALLALRAEQADICSQCGHPMSICRDPSTQGRWLVEQHVCEPSRVAEAAMDNARETKHHRGLVLSTRLTGGR